MASCNTKDLRDIPSVLETVGPSALVRAMDLLAGPLALAAAGLTFFMAYELTVTQPTDSLATVKPALNSAVAAPVAAPQLQAKSTGNGPRLASAQADPKTISMVADAAPERY